MTQRDDEFEYEPWRHGGWYVTNIRYPSGAIGCVSNNYPDKKWRIACDTRDDAPTYPTRKAAAQAERALVEELRKRQFSWNANGNITFGDRVYEQSSMGTTSLGLHRAQEFAAWLNECLASIGK